jgi:hypothetical protein
MSVEPTKGDRQLARPGESDYHAVLLRVIQSTTQDPAQLRSLVYELARIKLRRETWLQEPALGPDEAKEHLRALEEAIADVEALTGNEDDLRPSRSQDLAPISVDRRGDGEVTIIDPPRMQSREPISIVWESTTPKSLPWRLATRFVQAAGVAVLGVVIYVLIAGRSDIVESVLPGLVSKPKEERLALEARLAMLEVKTPVAPPPPPFPLPTTYGVYALSQGRLFELEMLPQKPPDERVLIGPILSKASPTTLPDGKVFFIVFRRDLVTNAPERVAIRTVARIARTLSFEGGKPTTTTVDSMWTIRGRSHEFRVAPLGEEQQMIVVKPENEDVVLSPGRYAMVLKGQAYDFTVEGVVTDPTQCLERVEAANGTVYSPCKSL